MSYAVPYAGGRHRAARTPAAAAAAAPTAASAVAPVVAPPRRRVVGIATNIVLLLGVLLFVGLAIGPHVLGYRTATMLTGSMSPGINPGDVVVTVPKAAGELEVGDIITYQIPIEDHRVETHRVTEVNRIQGGTVEFRTKGDANDGVDPWTAVVRADDTVWETRQVVPHLGTAIRSLRSPIIQRGLFWFAFAGVLALGLSMIWRPAAKPLPAELAPATAPSPAAAARPTRTARGSRGSRVTTAKPRVRTLPTNQPKGRTMTKQEQAVAGAVFMVLVAVIFLVSISYAVLSLT